jgi:DNA-binding response OmpR family regulator
MPVSWVQPGRILLLSADMLHTKMTSFLLQDAGHTVISASSDKEAIKVLQADPPDLILLDTSLREGDSLELCRQLRTQFNRPIIFLAKRSEVQDRVLGLHAGADDYVGQPFEPQELLARIQAVLRRYQQRLNGDRAALVVGAVSLEPVRRAVSAPNRPEAILTEREYQILHFLMQQPGQVVSTNELLSAVWGKETSVNHNLVYIYISRLRRKMGDNPQQPRFLVKIDGQGYSFVP